MDKFQSRLIKQREQLWNLIRNGFENQIRGRLGSEFLRQLEDQLLYQLWVRLHNQIQIDIQVAEEA